VIPELASRAHQQQVVPVVQQALREAGIRPSDLAAIGYTRGPGLIGALLVGSSFAKSMAQSLRIPAIGVHHLRAHVLANFLEEPAPVFPFLCLTVSGGHTQLVLAHDFRNLELIGETGDDAAGEAFDKAAKMLGLPYPGGPLLDRIAATGNPQAFSFPEPRVPGLSFSFSGLKTAILYFLQEQTQKDPQFIESRLADLCASIRARIVSILMHKLEKAALQYGIREIALAGGVSANSLLRSELQKKGQQLGWRVHIPALSYCTDNAAMIAVAAWQQFMQGEKGDLTDIPSPRMPL